MLRGGVERTGAEGVGWLGFKRKEKGSSEMACWSSSYGGIAQFSRSQRPALKEQEAKKQGQFESGSSPGPVAEGAWGWEWGGAGEGVGSGDGGETRPQNKAKVQMHGAGGSAVIHAASGIL